MNLARLAGSARTPAWTESTEIPVSMSWVARSPRQHLQREIVPGHWQLLLPDGSSGGEDRWTLYDGHWPDTPDLALTGGLDLADEKAAEARQDDDALHDVEKNGPSRGPPYRVFHLQPGYAESTTLGTLRVTHAVGFPDIESAIEDLRKNIAAFLLAQPRRSCCARFFRASNQHQLDARFCGTCGENLDPVRAGTQAVDVQDFFMGLLTQTVDGAADTLRHFEMFGWALDGCPEDGDVLSDADYPPCKVRAVARWMGREQDRKGVWSRPYLEGTYPDGTTYCSFRTAP